MRTYVLSAALFAAISGSAALAQPSPPPAYPPGYAPAYPPPPSAYSPPPASSPPPAYPTAGAPAPSMPPAYATTGARPGNNVGTGMSLPLGNNASNINQQDTRSVIAPNLPSPNVGENAPAIGYLRAAQGSLAAGRTGEAQQALEMAQTRLLDRSVPLGQTDVPSSSPAVGLISQALQALSAGDRSGAVSYIHSAMETLRISQR